MFHLISNQVQSKMKHFVVKRMDSDLYLGSLIIFFVEGELLSLLSSLFLPSKAQGYGSFELV